MIKKLVFAWLSVLLVVTSMPHSVSALAESEQIEHVGNGYMDVYVDRESGRFVIETEEGHPLKAGDDDKSLLFAGDQPDTSFTTFRINGEDYIFGNDYGFLGMDSYFSKEPRSQGLMNQSVWHVEGLDIVQTLELVTDRDNPNIGNVKISYVVENTSNESVQVGSRILLDTMLGAEDASPISLSGSSQYVRTERELNGGQIPYYWRAVDDPLVPRVMAYGFLRGWGSLEPNRMTIAHWDGISATKWDYETDGGLDFTTSRNPYGTPDSAVALYWNPNRLAPGEQAVYETYYGLGSFLTAEKQAKFNAQLFGPRELAVNETRDDYVEDTFDIRLELDNSLSESETLHQVQVQLGLPAELELVDGADAITEISQVPVNGTHTVTWRVKAKPQMNYKAARYWVSIQEPGSEQVMLSRYIVMPALSGMQPNVQVLDVLPNKKFIEDDKRDLYLKGRGFEALRGNFDFEMHAVRHRDGKSYPISNYTVSDDQQMIVQLDSMWANGILETGAYTLSIEAGEYGSFEKTFELTREAQYQSRDYGILTVVKDNETYSIMPVQDEQALRELEDRFDEVLLHIRGDIRELSADGTTLYEIQPGATMNAVVLFEESVSVGQRFDTEQVLVAQKKPRDLSHGDDYVEIAGTGVLSIPNFPFVQGDFTIELEDGNDYALDADEDADQQSIVIEWDQLKWRNLIHQMANFPVTIKQAIIGDRTVSFGGSLALDFTGAPEEEEEEDEEVNPDLKKPKEETEADDEDDPFKLRLALDEARFGLNSKDRFGFIGLRAEGEIGVPENLMPGMDLGAEARLLVDTLDRIYELEADVEFQVIEMHGLFTIRFTESSIPILDNFEFAVGNEPGIPLVPPFVVAYITQGGGGFRNLYDTAMGNFEVLPPLKLIVIGGMDIAKIISAEDMRLEASLRGIEFEGGFEVMQIDIFERVYGSLLVEDSYRPTVEALLGADLNVIDVIKGNVYATVSYDPDLRGIMGPIYIAGGGSVGLYIPDDIKFIGGEQLAGVEAEISTSKVYAKAEVIKIPFSVTYHWGDNKPEVDVFSLTAADGSGPIGLAKQKLYAHPDDRGASGVMTYGSNIREVSAIVSGDTASSRDRYAVKIASPGYAYSVDVADMKYALMEFAYRGEVPELEVRDPHGNLYELVEGENYRIQDIPADVSASGTHEQRVYVSAVDPIVGEWTIQSNQELTGRLLEALPIPELTSVEVEQTGDHEAQVHWQTANAEGQQVALYITENAETDSGRLLLDGLDATSGSTTIALPDTMPSGSYHIKAVLYDEETNYDSLYSAAGLNIHNMYEPAAPDQAEVAPIGNGYMQVQWSYPSGQSVDGFMLQVLDEAGQPVEQAGLIEVEGERRTANIGGSYEDLATGEQIGMLPGASYRIAITPYREIDGNKVYGTSTVTDAALLPEPAPAEVELAVEGNDGNLAVTEDAEGNPLYLSTESDVQLSLQADQDIASTIRVNGDRLAEQSGAAWDQSVPLREGMNMIEVTAVNEHGDLTVSGVRVRLDSAAPDLKIESPAPSIWSSEPEIRVKGVTEPGAVVTVNGEPITVDGDGLFDTMLSVDGYLSRSFTIVAQDEAGNRTAYVSEVLNESVGSFERVEIRPSTTPSMFRASAAVATDEDREQYPVSLDQPYAFELVGIDEASNESVIDPANVEWEFLVGNNLAELSEQGVLQASYEGEMIVKAAYQVSTEFAFEDTIFVQATAGSGGEDSIDPGEYEDWYDPDAPELDDGRNPRDDDDNDSDTGAVPGDGEDAIDRLLEDILQSIIEQEQEAEFLTYAELSEQERTVISIDERARLTVFPQLFGEQTGIGVGRIRSASRYFAGTPYRLIGDIYELKTNKPVLFEQEPELRIRFALEEVGDAENLGIYWYNDRMQRWEYAGGELNPLQGTVTAKLPHFSKYALLEHPNMRRFVDMQGRWSELAVNRLTSIGVIDGMQLPQGWSFAPEQTITREAFIKLLVAASGAQMDEAADLPKQYADRAEAGVWANAYLTAALEKGWLAGTAKDGQAYLEPKRPITRAEAAAMIARMLDGLQAADSSAASFKDEQQLPAWAADAIRRLHNAGILNGYEDGTFRPQQAITREEAAVMVLGILDWLYEEGKSLSE